MSTTVSDVQISENQEPALLTRLGYLTLILIIGCICVYDNILNICFAHLLPETEQNPLCRLIIEKYGGVKQLILIKSYMTLLGVSMMIALVYTRFRICIAVIFILSLCLFFYLTFYCPEGDYSIHRLIKENKTSNSPLRVVYNFYFVNSFEENSKLLNPTYLR